MSVPQLFPRVPSVVSTFIIEVIATGVGWDAQATEKDRDGKVVGVTSSVGHSNRDAAFGALLALLRKQG